MLKYSQKADKCKNCLAGTIKSIRDFFYTMDENGTGILSSRMIYDGITNLKSKDVAVDYTVVNDFFLKIYEYKSARININDFLYGLLNGYMERNFSKDGGSRFLKNKEEMNARV